MNVQIDLLKEHPDNSWIYGDIDVTEMVEDIQKSNWIKTLIVNQDNVILSGHRRFMAAKILGYDSLDVEYITTDNEIQMLERLLWENRNREKTTSQKQRESVKWREIYSEQAKKRFGGRHKINSTTKNFAELNEGETRDIVAKKVGIGSGFTLDTADKVAERIDELKESGKDREAKILETALNRSVSGALKFAEKDLSNVSDAVADKLKSGEVTVSTASSMAELPKEEQEDIVARGKDEILKAAKELKRKDKSQKESEKLINKTDIKIINNVRFIDSDPNIYVESPEYSENRYGDKIMSLNDSKWYVATTLERFFHRETMLEFSLREYAYVQTFPSDFKFIGSKSDIKKQIGNAVAPFMGEYISKNLSGKTCGDLFAGCGGFSCGLHKNGIQSKWAIEWDDQASKSYKLNFPNTKVINGNIKNIDISDLEYVDIIVGGPPCQGFSNAGSYAKVDKKFGDDPRNKLYLEFVRIVNHLRPNEFIMENVKEIECVKDEIISDFKSIGYDVSTQLVCGNEIGMKQNRKRFFFIGKKMK